MERKDRKGKDMNLAKLQTSVKQSVRRKYAK